MKTVAMICIFALLVACDSPSPRFSGIVGKRIVVDGWEFSVRHTDFEVEAIRLSGGLEMDRRVYAPRFLRAVRETSGCEVLPGSLYGDPNVMRADLKCPGADEALRPYRPDRLDCVGYEDPYFDGLVEIECDLIRG